MFFEKNRQGFTCALQEFTAVWARLCFTGSLVVLYFTSALRVVTRLPPGWARVTGHIMQVISGMRELGLASLGLDHLYIHCDSQHHVLACEHFFLPFVPALP